MSKLIHTIELNGARIEVYEESLMFLDDETEETWELTWPEVWKLCWEK